MKPYLELYVIDKGYAFRKYFDTEFERDKFKRKLKYSKTLRAIKQGIEYKK